MAPYKRLKEPKHYPDILSREEIWAVINTEENLKYKAIIATIYSNHVPIMFKSASLNSLIFIGIAAYYSEISIYKVRFCHKYTHTCMPARLEWLFHVRVSKNYILV
jgi:hypothetical protein